MSNLAARPVRDEKRVVPKKHSHEKQTHVKLKKRRKKHMFNESRGSID
jgi:hypothetical protein